MSNPCSLDMHIRMPDPEKLRKEMDNSFGTFMWTDEDCIPHGFNVDTAEIDENDACVLHVFGEINWSMNHEDAKMFVKLLASEYDAESLDIDYWEPGFALYGRYEWDGKELVDKQGDGDLWDDESDDDWDAKWELVMANPTVVKVADIWSKANAKKSAE